MKKLFKNFLGLALSVMVLASCSQMATYEQADLAPDEVAAAAKNGFNLTPYGSGGNENARAFVSNLNCETEPCLALGVAETFTTSANTGTISSGANSKVVSATVSLIIGADNMAYYKIDYQSQRTAGSSNAAVYLYGTLNGYSFGSNAVSVGNWNTTNPLIGTFSTPSFDYTTVECGDTFSYSLTEVSFGTNGAISGTQSLLAYCSGCDIEGNEFTGEAVSCGESREANFVFGSEDGVGYFKMQGGLTNFTGDDAVVTIYDGIVDVTDSYTVTQTIPGGSSNRTIIVEGTSLGECGSIRVNITWGSSNSGGVITGTWSVKDAGGVEYAPEVLELSCPV